MLNLLILRSNHETVFLYVTVKLEWNLEGRLQGAKGDSPLLKESKEQVRELGHYLSDTHFDLVFSSDLPRAKKLQSSSWSLKT